MIDRRNSNKDFEQPATIASRIRSLLAPQVESSVEGIDLNRFRRYDLLDPAALFASGRRFAIIEATWGMAQPDAFKEFWPRLLDAGFLLLGYGFFCIVLVIVLPMVKADGGGWFFQLRDQKGRGGETLYIRDEDADPAGTNI